MGKIVISVVGIIGLLLIAGAGLALSKDLSDSDTVDAMLPDCQIEDDDQDFPFPGNDEVTCYWGMSGEVLEIPSEAIAANVDVEITWSKSGVWIGIAEASEASKCEVAYFGILEEFIGKKYGGYLLSEALKLGFRKNTKKVWLHTCSLDHKHALKNYLGRGMKIFKSETINLDIS